MCLALRLISLCISQGQLLGKEQGGSEVVVRERIAELKFRGGTVPGDDLFSHCLPVDVFLLSLPLPVPVSVGCSDLRELLVSPVVLLGARDLWEQSPDLLGTTSSTQKVASSRQPSWIGG